MKEKLYLKFLKCLPNSKMILRKDDRKPVYAFRLCDGWQITGVIKLRVFKRVYLNFVCTP